MKKFTLVLIYFFIFVGCRDQEIKSTWLNDDISIDGIIEDWKDIPRIYEEDLKIMLSVSNNHDDLILMYCFNDPVFARMIVGRGVTIWFNDENKKEKNFGIAFKNDLLKQPKKKDREQLRNRNQQMPSGKKLRELFKSGQFTIELKDTLSGLLLEEVSDIEAGVDQIEGLYGFEIKVALSVIKNSKTVLKIPDDKKIKIGIEIPEMKSSMSDHKSDGIGIRGGGRGGGRGGMRGGGMGGRGSAPSGGGKRPDMSAKEIWTTIVLAEK